MSTSSPTEFHLSTHVPKALGEVFQTMLNESVRCIPFTSMGGQRITGSVALAGEHINGVAYLHLPETFAREIATLMLSGELGTSATDDEVNDVVGELTNMLAGMLKSFLCEADQFSAVSTPSVIRGTFAIETLQGGIAESFSFECRAQRINVEVHLKLD